MNSILLYIQIGAGFYWLPSVDNILAIGVHIFDFKDGAIVKGDRSVEIAVGLMALCACKFFYDKAADVIIEGCKGQIEASVLTDKLPWLEPALFAGEFLYVNSADFVGLAVIEQASFGGVGVVTMSQVISKPKV